MTLFGSSTPGTIGSIGLYLLFVWLISAAAGSWVSERKGYGEKVGLTFGLLLTFVGLLIVVFVLPGRPGSAWKVEGRLPRRTGRPSAPSGAPVLQIPDSSETPPPATG